MKKTFVSILTLLSLTLATSAQVKRGVWDLGPVVTTTNTVYGMLAQNITHYGVGGFVCIDEEDAMKYVTFMNKNRWWIPTFRDKFNVMQQIKTPDGKAKMKWWDWGLRNYSLGYHVGYMSYTAPIGFDVQVDYERQSWKAKMPGQNDFKDYAKQMVVPTALLKFRLGDFAENQFNFIVEAGAKYNYAFKAKGDYDDEESVENGFTGVFGIGLVNPSTHTTLQVRYEHDFFDYFDKDFTTETGLKPYEDVKTKHGALGLFLSIAF